MDTQRNYRVTPQGTQRTPNRPVPQMYEDNEDDVVYDDQAAQAMMRRDRQSRGVRRPTSTERNGQQRQSTQVQAPPSIREQLAQQQRRMEDRNSRYFKRAEGLNRVRVMPSWRGKDDPCWWIELPTHEDVGPDKKFVTCQQFFKKECLVCDLRYTLSQSSEARDLNAANDLTVKYGIYANVARNEPDAIVKPWRMPQSVYYYLKACYADPQYGEDPLDAKNGYDLIFMYNSKGKGAAQMYPRIELARHPSPILVKGGRKALPNLDLFWPPHTAREMRALINGEG